MPLSVARPASLLLLAAVAVATGNASAQGRGNGGNAQNDRPPPREQHDRREDHRALSDAVRRVERRTGGQVLSAERVPFDGRNVNRVKVVDSSGRVRVYVDDPQRDRQPQTPPQPQPPARDDD
ncbi:MAG TPA: hypothetical protein VJ484_12700 [Lysobacter sp.]|nr:hypothetical protein [Lysobacter sp.]